MSYNGHNKHHETDCSCSDNHKQHNHNCSDEDCSEEQRHVHEFLGSTRLAELEEDPHNHRFAGVTGEAIGEEDCHVHKINTNTDFFEDHFHEVIVTTGPAIKVGRNKHIHFVYGVTTERDGHVHKFVFATLIDNPIGQ